MKNKLLLFICFSFSNLFCIHGGYTGFTPREFDVPKPTAEPYATPAQVVQELYTGKSIFGYDLTPGNSDHSAISTYINWRNPNSNLSSTMLAGYPTGPGFSTPPIGSDGILNAGWKMGKLLSVPNLSNDDKVSLINAFCAYDSNYMDSLSNNDFRNFYRYIVEQPDNLESKFYDTSCPANYAKVFTRWSTPTTQSTSAQAVPTDQKTVESACPFVYQWQGPTVIPQAPTGDIPTSSVSAIKDYITNTVTPYQTKINALITKFNDDKNGFKIQVDSFVSNVAKNDPYLRTLNDSLTKISDANKALLSANVAYKACAANPPSDKAKGYCSTEPLKAYVDSANALYDAIAKSMAILAKCNVNAQPPQRSVKLITVTQSDGKVVGLEYPKGNILQFNTVSNYDKDTFQKNVKDCTNNYIKHAYAACFDQFKNIPQLINKAINDFKDFINNKYNIALQTIAKNQKKDEEKSQLSQLGINTGMMLLQAAEDPIFFAEQTTLFTALNAIPEAQTPQKQFDDSIKGQINQDISNDISHFDASNTKTTTVSIAKLGYDVIIGGTASAALDAATKVTDGLSNVMQHGHY